MPRRHSTGSPVRRTSSSQRPATPERRCLVGSATFALSKSCKGLEIDAAGVVGAGRWSLVPPGRLAVGRALPGIRVDAAMGQPAARAVQLARAETLRRLRAGA